MLKVLPITQDEARMLDRVLDVPSMQEERVLLATVKNWIPRLAYFEIQEVVDDLMSKGWR